MPIKISPGPRVRIGCDVARVTPADGLRLAEQLIRLSTRAMVAAEIASASPAKPRTRARKMARC